MGLNMQVSLKLDFDDMKTDTNSMVYNVVSEFCDFYESEKLSKQIPVEVVNKNVFDQIQKDGIGRFYAKKDDTPFAVTIHWEDNKVVITNLPGAEQADITFYIYRALEVCNNFAIYDLVAEE